MTQPFTAVRMTDRVYWVGAIDWGIRDFHGYATSRGTTYNAYLVMADKVTLVDTVKAAFCDEMMARIASVVEPRKIEVVISNHSEMDHTGCLPRTIEAVRPEAVYASPNGVKALGRHFGMGTDVLTEVKDGQTVSLGNMSVRFLETRMLHWPDSMVSYLPEEQVLFSQDGFGQHLASTERFADEIAPDVLRYEAAKYYANILLPFSPLVAKLLARLHELNLPLKLLAPDHGPAYRKDFGWILDLWGRWAEQRPARKAVVAYDTMWGSTAIMAGAVTEGLLEGGAGSVKVMPLVASQRSDVATELLEAGALVLGSPTLNNNLFPTLADLVAYLEGLRPKNLVGAAFGSYGWSGEGVARLEAGLKAIGVDRVAESLKVQYVPTIADLERCRNLGRTVGEALAARCAGGGA